MIVKEALANGRLGAARPGRRARGGRERARRDADALALAAVLARPWADVVLSGAPTRRPLASNLAAADLALSDDVLAALAPLEEDSETYWSARSALPWN